MVSLEFLVTGSLNWAITHSLFSGSPHAHLVLSSGNIFDHNKPCIVFLCPYTLFTLDHVSILRLASLRVNLGVEFVYYERDSVSVTFKGTS